LFLNPEANPLKESAAPGQPQECAAMIYYAGQFLTLPFQQQEKQGYMGK
jgi:hypothetical protein